MEITLEKATEIDAEIIFHMQVESFSSLLEKYKDYETSPASEPIDRTISRINHPDGGFYKNYSKYESCWRDMYFTKKKIPQDFGLAQCLFIQTIKGTELLKKY